MVAFPQEGETVVFLEKACCLNISTVSEQAPSPLLSTVTLNGKSALDLPEPSSQLPYQPPEQDCLTLKMEAGSTSGTVEQTFTR